MTPSQPPERTDLLELADRVEAATKHMLPAAHHDTPDYAEITGPSFMMMTMQPLAIMGLLNALPEIINTLRAHAAMLETRDEVSHVG